MYVFDFITSRSWRFMSLSRFGHFLCYHQSALYVMFLPSVGAVCLDWCHHLAQNIMFSHLNIMFYFSSWQGMSILCIQGQFLQLGLLLFFSYFYGLVVRMDRSVYRACWVRDPHINFGTWGVRIFHFLVSFWKFFNSGCFQLFCYLPSVSGWELCWVRQLKVCPFYRGNNGEDGTWILVLSQVNTV